MYGKTYESMYQGSMVGAGLNVFAVWNYIVTNTHFGVIELNPKLLKAILGGEIGEIEAALEYLSREDPESRSKEEGGKRIVKEGQFQYRVVNWLEYQAMKNADDLREYNRRKQSEYRARQRAKKLAARRGPSPGETTYVKTYEDEGAEAADALLDAERSIQGLGTAIINSAIGNELSQETPTEKLDRELAEKYHRNGGK